jgi:hypothetical protein
MALFVENMKCISLWKTFANLKPVFGSESGIGSGSAFVKKGGSGSAYNECGSKTLLKPNFS